MASVTIYSDFGVQKNKVCHGFHCFPIICHEGIGCQDLIQELVDNSLKDREKHTYVIMSNLHSMNEPQSIHLCQYFGISTEA